MLTAEGCELRRRRLFRRLPEQISHVVLSEPQHVTYFSGFYASPYEFRSQNASSTLILGADGSSMLVVDNVMRSYGEAAFVDRLLVADWYNGQDSAPRRQDLLVRTSGDELKKLRPSGVGTDSAVPIGILDPDIEASERPFPTDIGAEIHAMRRHKDKDEIAVIRRAIVAAEAGFAAGREGIRPGMTELEAYDVVRSAATKVLGDRAIVYGDFVSGSRTEKVGGPPTSRIVEPNELFIMDFSVVVNGYRGDMASTVVAVGGKATEFQLENARHCLDAMKAGEACLKAGVPAVDVDRAVRSTLTDRGLGANFPHHVGHGLGLGHPDPPYFVPKSTDVLVEGDVVTLEPGLYFAGKGGMRFEHNYLITTDGFERLSNHRLGLE